MVESPGVAFVGEYPLSPLQQGMLFHSLDSNERGVGVEQVLCSLNEALDVPQLLAAWEAVVARHDVLRTSLHWEGKPEPVQHVQPRVKLPVRVIDWRQVSPDDQRDQLAKLMAADRAKGFALTEAPLMRVTLIARGTSLFEMLWTFHHVLLDSQSVRIVLLELFGHYDAHRSGRLWHLPEPHQYVEYIDWLSARTPRASETFWRRHLGGVLAPTPLLACVPRGLGEDAGRVETTLAPEDTYRLHAFARKAGCTLRTLVSGAWALLLSRYTGEDDVVFGVTRTCRQSSFEGADETVGLFLNTLPLRVNTRPASTVFGWLTALRADQIALRQHEHTPLAEIRSLSDMPRSSPLFDTVVVFETQRLDAVLRRGGEWKTRQVAHHGQSPYPVTLVCHADSELMLRLEYHREALDDTIATRMLQHLQTILKGLTRDESAQLIDVPMLGSDERAELLPVPRPSGFQTFCLHERFERRASETPDAPALSFAGRTLTYDTLNRQANQLAHRLRALGIGPEVLVGVQLERSPELVVAMLAVLKAGGACVPLDPGESSDRLRFIVDDAQLSVIVMSRQMAANLPPLDAAVVCVEDVETGSSDNLPPLVEPDNLAYVMYTSGQADKPTGVLITHANVSRLIDASEIWFQFGRDDVWALCHSHASAFSVWEVWGALLYGGRLVVVPSWVRRDPDAFIDLLAREHVTVLNQTPSAFRRLVQADGECSHPRQLAMRAIVLSGEALDLPCLMPWFNRHGDERPRVFNTFGAIETTGHATYRRISKADVENGRGGVIGVPIADLDIYVLDRSQQLAPVGVPGEMYIGGPGVARGYLDRTDLTRRRFVVDPLDRSDARLYRTGCRGRWLPNGELEYLGRIDDRLEICGRRLDLGEIEAVVRRSPGVRQTVVVVREEGPADPWLVVYVVLEPGASVDELCLHVRPRLPKNLLPTTFVSIQALPLTPDGKVDRQALPTSAIPAPKDGRRVAPGNATEQALALIWASVLRCEMVGVEDDFFELGGDSIASVQVVARSRQLGLPVTTRDVFSYSTVAALAAAIASRTEPPPMPRRRMTGATLTPIERRFVERPFSNRNHSNQSLLLNVPSSLDVSALDAALTAVVAHHDAFRLRLREDAEGWHGSYMPMPSRISVERIDLRDYPNEVLSTAIESTAASVQAGLDITDGPTLRVVLFACAGGLPCRLLIVVHQAIADAGSWPVFLEDLETAYDAARAGREPALPNRTTSMQSWAERLVGYANADALEGLASWTAEVDPQSAILPRDHDADLALNTEGTARTVTVSLTEADTDALLHRATAAFGTQVDELLLASLAHALVRWTGRPDVLLDVEDERRPNVFDDVDLSRTIGWFATIYPVRLEVGTRSLGDLVHRTKERLRQVHHRGLSFGALRYMSADPRIREALASGPRAELRFHYRGKLDVVPSGSSLFTVASESSGPIRAEDNQRSHLIDVVASIQDGRLKVQWSFSNGFHDVATISAVASRCIEGLRELVAHGVDRSAIAPRPSDFLLARLNPSELERLSGRFPLMTDIYPLTPMQQLVFSMDAVEASTGFEQWEFQLEGPLDVERLRSAWQQVTARHAILRTVFVQAGAAPPHQIVLEHVEVPWHVEDWREQSPQEQDDRLAAFLSDDRGRSFDLASPPLLRLALLRTGDTTYRLVLSTHQLLVDRWSVPRIVADLSAYYTSGPATALPPARVYRDYVKWVQQDGDVSEVFWRRLLGGVTEPTPAPILRDPSGQPEPAGDVVRLAAPGVTAAIRAAARRQQVTVGDLVTAAWSVVLAHRSGRSDVVFGVSFVHRPDGIAGIESMVGPCVHNLPVRACVDLNEPIGQWLRGTRRVLGEVGRHQTMSLSRVHACSNIPAWSRMFESLLVIQDDGMKSPTWSLDRVEMRQVKWAGSTGYPATVVARLSEQLEVMVLGAGDGFDGISAAAAADDLLSVLERLTNVEDGTVAHLLACLPSERRGTVARASAEPRRRRGPRLAPRTDMERALVRIWRELFGEEIGTDENYFELGAHSLMLVRAHEGIVSTIDPALPIAALIQFPTVRALAAHLRTRVAPVRRADNTRSYRPGHAWAAEPSRMEAVGKAPRA